MSWNGSDNNEGKVKANERKGNIRSSTSTSHFNYKALVAGLIVVLGGGLAAWFIFGNRGATGPEDGDRGATRSTAIAEVAPAKVERPVDQPEHEAASKSTHKEPVEYENEECRKIAEQRRAHALMWAKKLKTDKRLQRYLKEFKPVQRDFDSGTEQMLDWIFNAKVGEAPPPPIPPLSDFELEHIDEILDSVNEIKAEDDEHLAERKKMVDEAKMELKAYLDNGGTVREFLDHYHAELVKAWESKQAARHSLDQVMGEGDNELSLEYLQKVNKLLEEQGVPGIELTDEEKEELAK